MLTNRNLTSNEQILGAQIEHKIYSLRYGKSLLIQIRKLLDENDLLLKALIIDKAEKFIDNSQSTNLSAQRSFEKKLQEQRNLVWIKIRDLLVSDLTEFTADESERIIDLVKKVTPLDLDLVRPSRSEVKKLFNSSTMLGDTFKEHLNAEKNSDVRRIRNQLRLALIEETDIGSVWKRIKGTRGYGYKDGVLKKAMNHSSALVYSAVTHGGSVANNAVAKSNPLVFTHEKFLATLDVHTTFICASNDGKVWELDEGKFPPLHFNCRSIRTIFISEDSISKRGFDPTTERETLDLFARNNNIAKVKNRENLPRGYKGQYDTFARQRKRALVGQVPETVEFEEFLKSRSKTFQDEYFKSVVKADAFRNGKKIGDFIGDDGMPLSIENLIVKGVIEN